MKTSIRDFVSEEALARVAGASGVASRLPRVAYTDKDFQALEYRRWLGQTWLFVGRAHEIPNAGDVTPVPGHPVFLVRGDDDEVRAFQNACRHRGHRLVEGPCNKQSAIICPYHAWTYGLDGRLLATPHFGGHGRQKVAGFDPANYGLKPVRCAQWHDWLFLNLDGEAPPIDEFTAPIAAKFPDVDFGRLKHYLTIDVGQVGCNWKLALENNMEPYHVPVAHRESAAGQPLKQHYMVEDGPVMGCAVDVPGSDYTNEAGGNDLDNLDMSARYLLLMPNFFLTSYAPDKMIDSLIVPDSRDPTKCWVQTAWYTTSGATLTADEVETWRALEQQVADEDIGIMTGVQNGLEADVTDDGGVLSPAWESCLSSFYRRMVTALEA